MATRVIHWLFTLPVCSHSVCGNRTLDSPSLLRRNSDSTFAGQERTFPIQFVVTPKELGAFTGVASLLFRTEWMFAHQICVLGNNFQRLSPQYRSHKLLLSAELCFLKWISSLLEAILRLIKSLINKHNLLLVKL